MNEIEICTIAGMADTAAAAGRAMDTQGADVVIVKSGIRGATLFQRGEAPRHVPAFRSARVFKIGTGDVFSAIFAYYWAEAVMPAHDAAIRASKAVAAYCETRTLPPPSDRKPSMVALSDLAPGVIEIAGAIDTIGRRWTMEEARFRLRELGLSVHAPPLGDVWTHGTATAALLILAEGIDTSIAGRMQLTIRPDLPVVVLQECGIPLRASLEDAGATHTYTDDFASALYLVAWAATPQPTLPKESPVA
jgi:hypothetical protein